MFYYRELKAPLALFGFKSGRARQIKYPSLPGVFYLDRLICDVDRRTRRVSVRVASNLAGACSEKVRRGEGQSPLIRADIYQGATGTSRVQIRSSPPITNYII